MIVQKTTFAAFVAFWSAAATLVAVGALAPTRPAIAEGKLPVIDAATLAEHDSLEDCWMAIDGKVYDLSDYIPQHPTPPSIMKPWCGREATEGMRTKGYGRDHSSAAWAMLDDYLIGTFEEG